MAKRYRQFLKEMGYSNDDIFTRMNKNLKRMRKRKGKK